MTDAINRHRSDDATLRRAAWSRLKEQSDSWLLLAINLGTETLPALALDRERVMPHLMLRPARSTAHRLISGPRMKGARTRAVSRPDADPPGGP